MERTLPALLILGALGAGAAVALGAGEPAAKASAKAPAPVVAVISPLAKLLPHEAPRGADAIELRLLRGECEAAQVAIRAPPDRRLLVSPRAFLELPSRLYRVARVELDRPSGPEGARGAWPDPLVPQVDAYVGEQRNAFPLAIAPGRTESLLLELCAPGDAKPAALKGALRLELGDETRELPIHARIERASIPATASLPTTFGFSALRASHGHFGRAGTPAEVRALDRLYRTALLRHRLSAHGGTMEPPHFERTPRGLRLDFRAYDAEVGPFLAGEVLPSGARATSVELRTHPGLATDEEHVAYWKAIAAHHRERGWKALLFDYAKDEPARSDLPEVARRAKLVKAADPSIRVLLTASHDGSLAGLVDLWAPNLNCLYVKKEPGELCPWRASRSAYEQARAGGALVWWYQSCSSHGCDEGEAPDPSYFRGWPSYVIDAPGTRARAMAWLAFAEGIGGELYWDTVYAYAPEGKARDPWARGALRAFGGNGDGTLFYPGTPARIGGRRHVPVESLRLHHIRDGMEDYELLALVAARPGGRALARAAAAEVAAAPYRVTDDPAAIERARARLLDFLAAAPAPKRPGAE